MILLVDIGNSRIKWAYLEQGQLRPGDAVPHDHETVPEEFTALVNEQDGSLERITAANVVGREFGAVFSDHCLRYWDVSVEFSETSATGHGVVNGYTDHHELGVDRWLALIAARYRREGAVCVIDCGTAVTVDIIDAAGRHRGGVIIPGMNMMMEALAEKAEGITPSHISDGYREPFLGRSTKECVAVGTKNAIIGGIERVIAGAQEEVGTDMQCLVTGGAAADVLPLLPDSCQHVPDLVLEGLKIIAEEVR